MLSQLLWFVQAGFFMGRIIFDKFFYLNGFKLLKMSDLCLHTLVEKLLILSSETN